jgi:hypothetical protein
MLAWGTAEEYGKGGKCKKRSRSLKENKGGEDAIGLEFASGKLKMLGIPRQGGILVFSQPILISGWSDFTEPRTRDSSGYPQPSTPASLINLGASIHAASELQDYRLTYFFSDGLSSLVHSILLTSHQLPIIINSLKVIKNCRYYGKRLFLFFRSDLIVSDVFHNPRGHEFPALTNIMQ